MGPTIDMDSKQKKGKFVFDLCVCPYISLSVSEVDILVFR